MLAALLLGAAVVAVVVTAVVNAVAIVLPCQSGPADKAIVQATHAIGTGKLPALAVNTVEL